ncbi:MAG: MFS transporter [Nitrospinae bacterium]|nr:MFS transporter [Nitrospinota bacterium]
MKKRAFSFPPAEKKAIAGLASVLSARMFGLSVLIPVFSVYAMGLPDSTPLLAGIAFSVYGLTQAVLQIPFGYFSDRFGRKPVVIGGLALFAAGSVLGGLTTNIYVLIVARFIQGAGAIASACFAWIADLTDVSRRNMAMAFMGMSIGGGIVMGMILGPVIAGYTGVQFLFWLTAGLSVVAILITAIFLKEPSKEAHHNEFSLNPRTVLGYAMDPNLLRLDAAGMLVNMSMIAAFFMAPIQIAKHFEMGELWKIYLPLALFGGMAMMFSSKAADRGAARKVITGALLAVAVAFALMAHFPSIYGLLAGFSLFFAAFSVLEATLPAAVSKLADPTHKGAIIGVFNFSVFMGTFFGGMLAGVLALSHETLFFYLIMGACLIAAGLVYSAPGLDRSENA